MVISSHELDRAEALADRVVTIDGGVTGGAEPAPRHLRGHRADVAADATPGVAPEVTHGAAASLVAGDLRIEARSRVALQQVAPFAAGC